MSTVTLVFAHSVATALDLTLMPDGRVMSGDRVVHRLALGPGGKLGADAYFRFIEWGGQHQPDRLALVAACARATRLNNLGTLGLALKTAPTLRDSLKRLECYFLLLTDTAVYHLDEGQQRPFFSLQQCKLNHPALSLRNECAIAGILRQLRFRAARMPRFERVTFRHVCKGDQTAYEQYFQAWVEFQVAKDGFEISAETLASPTKQGNQAVSDFFTGHLYRELDQVETNPSLKDVLLRLLSV